jgi:hypothetical protein
VCWTMTVASATIIKKSIILSIISDVVLAASVSHGPLHTTCNDAVSTTNVKQLLKRWDRKSGNASDLYSEEPGLNLGRNTVYTD